VTSHTYKISVLGSLGPATHEAFADMVVETEPTITVLSGPSTSTACTTYWIECGRWAWNSGPRRSACQP
jgi:hypothetical protein